MNLVQLLKRSARAVGFEVHRYNPVRSLDARFFHLLGVHAVDGVYDVGANDGQFGTYLREGGYAGPIVSFEPLEEPHRVLTERARTDPGWSVAPRGALGAEPGVVQMQVAGNSTSSSLLPMLSSHIDAAPYTAPVGTQEVHVRRLDDIELASTAGWRRALLKVDTQGYEMPVLQGATDTLTRCAGVQVELSLVPLYEGQALYLELTEWLLAHDFALWGVLPGFCDPRSGRLLQMDGLFFRNR